MRSCDGSLFFFVVFSSRRRHTRCYRDWSSDVCSSDLELDDELEVVREEEVDVSEIERGVDDAPVVKLVNFILTDAIKRRASDIHIEPYEKEFRVRYRIDGVLY